MRDAATPWRSRDRRGAGAILAELARLPEPQRRALLMTAVAGSSHEEAASALGVSGGAVRGMVYRARAALATPPQVCYPPRCGTGRPAWATAARPCGRSHGHRHRGHIGFGRLRRRGRRGGQGGRDRRCGGRPDRRRGRAAVGRFPARAPPSRCRSAGELPARPPMGRDPDEERDGARRPPTGSGEGGGADDRRAAAVLRARRTPRPWRRVAPRLLELRRPSNSTGSSGSGRSGTPGRGSGSSGGGSAAQRRLWPLGRRALGLGR